MAVAVPMIMAATGASAAVGAAIGVSATLVTAATGVLVAATGIGAKINKAASKVFGEDLVNFANIAGSVFMATGGDVGDLFGGGAEAAGALSSAGGSLVDPLMAGADIASAAAMPSFEVGSVLGGAGDAAGALASAQPAFGVQMPSFEVGSVLGNGPAAAPGLQPASQPGGMPGGGALKTASEWWAKQSDPTKAALIQVGGNVVAGTAQGVAKAREMKDLRDERLRREAIFNSGSKLGSTYGPRTPVVRGG